MTTEYETPTSRIVLLGLAFAALVVIGVMTVLRPEIEDADEPDEPATTAHVGALPATSPQAPSPSTP